MSNEIVIDGQHLSLADIRRVSRREARVRWSDDSRRAVERARSVVDRAVEEDRVVYGITTGFGKLSNVKINRRQLEELQANLIRSHACGTGNPLSAEETRAALLIRANVLAKGFSGVRPVVVETLVEMINRDVLPVIPEKGSVGACGDLAPSAHLALVLMGEGQARFEGELLDGAAAMARAGIATLTFQAKEGLAVLNGTQIMTAVGSLLLEELDYLLRMAGGAAALSTDGLMGTVKHFDDRIQQVRPHPGQIRVAEDMRRIMGGSQIMGSHATCDRVQDSYSLRCISQVHGAVADTLTYARSVLEREVNSATDNPLVFAAEDEVISGGNFHGEPVAFALDFLAIAAAEIASISERRIERLINPDLNDLPAFLVKEPGLNSGFMIAHVTTVSLVAENRILAHPASVDSLPTSANKEDHVSMGMTAALKLRQIVDNVRTVVGIEWLVAAQALDFRRPLRTSPALEAIHERIRRDIPFMERDRNISRDMEAMNTLLRSRELNLDPA